MHASVRLALVSGVLAFLIAVLPGRGFAQSGEEKSNSGYLGVRLENGDNGAQIVEVIPGSAADRAGLKVGDTIVSVTGKAIPDTAALVTTVGRHKAGDEIAMQVKRGEESLRIKVTLGRRPGVRERPGTADGLSPPTKPRLPKIPDPLPKLKPPPEK
jgi:S1-C subfamily serine protease